MTVKTETVLLTPEIARQWLDSNKMNRKLKEKHVRFLAREMSEGRWQFNGDTIVFDDKGILVDGQHRCAATVLADYSYHAIVVRGVEPQSRISMDAGARRSFADDLTMNGQGPNANLKETLLRRIHTWKRDGGLADERHITISRSELSRDYPEQAAAVDDAIALLHNYAQRFPSIGKGAMGFSVWLLLQAAPEKKVREFLSIMAIGSQNPADFMVVRLRNRLDRLHLENKGAGALRFNARMIGALQVYWIIKGWNAWLSGRTDNLNMPRDGVLTNPFPQPAKVEEPVTA